jgi:hypothetical protein
VEVVLGKAQLLAQVEELLEAMAVQVVMALQVVERKVLVVQALAVLVMVLHCKGATVEALVTEVEVAQEGVDILVVERVLEMLMVMAVRVVVVFFQAPFFQVL